MVPDLWHPAWTAALGNHLWQSTVVALLAWFLSLALRHNQARTRYWVWLIASLKFLLPFSLLIWLGGMLHPVYTAPIPQPAFAVVSGITEPFPQHVPVVAAKVSPATMSSVAPPSNPLPAVCLTIWLCGFLAVIFSWIRSWRRIRSAVRAASFVELLGAIPVLSSPHLSEPGVFGILRPVLILPKDIGTRLSAEQLKAILAHEMCHIRRRDNLTAAMHLAVASAFWFHPVVWWIKGRLLAEREQACDEAVLQSGNKAHPYAEAILRVCKFSLESPQSCLSTVTGADLKKRIERIMAGQLGSKLGWGRKLLLGTAGIAAVATPVVFGLIQSGVHPGQDGATAWLAGTWQEARKPGRQPGLAGLPTALKVWKSDAGGYEGTFYTLGKNGGTIPVSRIAFDGRNIKLWLTALDMTYEGTSSPDGQTMKGIWKEDSYPIVPMDFVRATPKTAWILPQPPSLPPMDEHASPFFAAASIKSVSNPESQQRYLRHIGDRRFEVKNESLTDIIAYAYDIQPKLVLRAPGWAGSDRYDIETQAGGEGAPSLEQWKVMLRKLLANRYKLSFHRESREVPVYVLSAMTSGIKLTKSPPNARRIPDLTFWGAGDLLCTSTNMDNLAGLLQQVVLDRPVLNRTSLTGRYDFTLKWKPDALQLAESEANHLGAWSGDGKLPLSQAIEQQVGVKLADSTAAVDVIVIDDAEKPIEN